MVDDWLLKIRPINKYIYIVPCDRWKFFWSLVLGFHEKISHASQLTCYRDTCYARQVPFYSHLCRKHCSVHIPLGVAQHVIHLVGVKSCRFGFFQASKAKNAPQKLYAIF